MNSLLVAHLLLMLYLNSTQCRLMNTFASRSITGCLTSNPPNPNQFTHSMQFEELLRDRKKLNLEMFGGWQGNFLQGMDWENKYGDC